ncbi:MAG: 4-hydroxy-tetrahydrodipicolinate synthase [Opitutales bacterium]|nr:4-hydroxy-tetrahydrodipicolinate synthase [Opitutales bacterium]
MSIPSYQGVYTALITPMRGDEILWDVLKAHVEGQIAAGVDGLVPVGTTGESPTLDMAEHLKVIETVAEVAKGRVPVIAGTGANATSEALHLSREAIKAGADALLQVAPYYNKPSQEGLYRHFAKVADSTDKPIILYSIPGRCGIEIGVGTVQRLAEAYPHVRTIKEAGGDVTRVTALRQACGDKLTVLSGDDGLILPFIAAGATGIVSVAANLAPGIIKAITKAMLQGQQAKALELQDQHLPLLTDVVFMEGNPVTIKEAMAYLGKIPTADVRLPLWHMESGNRNRLHQILDRLNLS